MAGGMESLSNSPFYMKRGGFIYGTQTLTDACDYDALTDPYSGWHMGTCAENTVKRLGIPRAEQDDYARLSHKRYQEAFDQGG